MNKSDYAMGSVGSELWHRVLAVYAARHVGKEAP